MRKTILVTSIMFSTILCSNIITTEVMGTTRSEEVSDENKITNQIMFVDERKANVIEKTVKGIIGDKINLNSIIPKGYKIVGDSNIFIISDSKKIRYVNVKSLPMENTVEFVDFETEEVVGTCTISGNTGDMVRKPIKEIPEGYSPSDTFSKNMKISAEETTQRIYVYKNVEEYEVLLRFVTSDGKVIDTETIKGREGERINVSEWPILPTQLELEDNQPLDIVIRKDTKIIDVKVKNNFIKGKLVFKDENGKEIFSKDLETSKSNPIVNPSYYLPNGYLLADNQSDEIKIISNKEVIIHVTRIFDNEINFVTKDGNRVGINHISGKSGSIVKVDKIKDFDIVGSSTVKIEPKEGYIHKVIVDGKKVDTTVFFKDYRERNTDKVISKTKLTGKVGDTIPLKLIPKGYGLYLDENYIINEPSFNIWVKKIVKTSINYIDPSGKVISKQSATNLDDEDIKLTAPKGYLLVNNSSSVIQSNRDLPVQNVLVVPFAQLPENTNEVMTQVNFIDKRTKNLVHSYVVQGKQDQKVKVQAPNGYELDKGISDNLTLDKAKTSVNIYVVEKNSTNESSKYSSVVLTKQSVTTLFDKNGNKLNNRALGSNSSWRVNQKLTHNGVTYYRVATNEYVKATDVLEYENVNSTVNTKTGSAKYLYDINGKRSEKRALAGNTAWFSDRSAIINGEKMYRVATNEWVKASDII